MKGRLYLFILSWHTVSVIIVLKGLVFSRGSHYMKYE